MTPEPVRRHYGLTFAVLALAGMSYALLQSLVAPALPVIQRDLHTTTTAVGGAIGGQVAASIIAGTVAASGLPAERAFTIAFAISAAALFFSFLAALAVPRMRSAGTTPVATVTVSSRS